MIRELYFAWYAIKKNIQSSAELRTSFVSNIIGMAINNTAFIIIWVYFIKSVGVINGWTAADIVALQGFGAISYGIVFSAGAGIRKLADYVAGGGFDRFMLSPKNLLLRVATSSFGVSALGDILFGVVCLIVYGIIIHATFVQYLLILVLIIISLVVLFSAALVANSASFIFTDAHSATNGLFELFMTPTLYHGGAFQGIVRFVFTFFIPSLLVGAIPVEIVRTLSIRQLATAGVVATLWLILSIKLFSVGVKKYESSNLMNFGD